MTTFFLIRHGANDLMKDTIAGRQAGVHLNQEGRRQAEQLAERLEHAGIGKIFSSPLERATETGEPLAKRLGLSVQIEEQLNEIDFGDWTGARLADLDALEHWKQWNVFRSGVRPPKGETMYEVQLRVISLMTRLHREFPHQKIVLLSHGDPIRAALLYWLGMPLDLVHRLEISPGSTSTVVLEQWGATVRSLNTA